MAKSKGGESPKHGDSKSKYEVVARAKAKSKGGGAVDEAKFFAKPDESHLMTDSELKRPMSQEFIDFLEYVFFLCLFCFVVFGPRNSDPFYMQKMVTDTFIENTWAPGQDFASISSPAEVFDWLERVAVPGMYPEDYATGKAVTSGMVAGAALKLGSPRLRLIRVNENKCTIAAPFQGSLDRCFGPYVKGGESEDVRGWRAAGPLCTAPVADPAAAANATLPNATCVSEVAYADADETGMLPYYSVFSKMSYGGGGLLVPLGDARQTAAQRVAWLRNSSFVDDATRAVFFEGTLYNAGSDLFASVQLAVEFLPSGMVKASSHNVGVSRLITPIRCFEGDGVTAWTQLVLFAEFVFYFMVLVYIYRDFARLRRVGSLAKYFNSGWTVLDAVNLGLFFAVMLYRSWNVFAMAEKIAAGELDPEVLSGDQFVNVSVNVYYALMLDATNALNAVLSFFKVFRFTKYHSKLALFTQTLLLASGDMGAMVVIIAVVSAGYSVAFHMAFGQALSGYADVTVSMQTLFRATLGDFDVMELVRVNYFLGPLLFVSYTVIMFFVILSMFLAIVENAFETVRAELLEAKAVDQEAVPLFNRDLHRFVSTPYRVVSNAEKRFVTWFVDYLYKAGGVKRPGAKVGATEAEDAESAAAASEAAADGGMDADDGYTRMAATYRKLHGAIDALSSDTASLGRLVESIGQKIDDVGDERAKAATEQAYEGQGGGRRPKMP